MSTLKLAIIEKDSSWDLYVDEKGCFSAIAKVKGAKDSHFGNRYHIVRLMNNGFFNVEDHSFTEDGLKALSGMHSRIMFNDDNSIREHWVKF